LNEQLDTGRIADENDSALRYSEVPLKGKNKTLVKILGGRDPCGVDTYDRNLAVFKIFWMPQMSHTATSSRAY